MDSTHACKRNCPIGEQSGNMPSALTALLSVACMQRTGRVKNDDDDDDNDNDNDNN